MAIAIPILNMYAKFNNVALCTATACSGCPFVNICCLVQEASVLNLMIGCTIMFFSQINIMAISVVSMQRLKKERKVIAGRNL